MAGKKYKKTIIGVQFFDRIIWVIANNRKIEITSANQKYFENNFLGTITFAKEAQGVTIQNIHNRVISQIFVPYSNIRAIDYEQIIENEQA